VSTAAGRCRISSPPALACTLGFPQFLRLGFGVFLKVGASVGVGACGMYGTDEVWVAAVEETAITLMEFGHGGGVEVLVWV